MRQQVNDSELGGVPESAMTVQNEGGAPRGVRLDPARVRREMDVRLWGVMAAARAAKVAPNTINKMLAGRTVRPDSADRLVQAFLDNVPVEGVAELLDDAGWGS